MQSSRKLTHFEHSSFPRQLRNGGPCDSARHPCRPWSLCGWVFLLCCSLAVVNQAEANSDAVAESSDAAPQFSAEDLEQFEREIRPLLHKRCYSCHSAESKVLQGGLRVDSRAHLLTGGDSGPAIVPGKVDESLLVEAIRFGGESYDMPPTGKLPDSEIKLLENWIARGAPFPSSADLGVAPQQSIDLEEGRRFWSFQPLRRVAVPELAHDDWSRNWVDRFILKELRERDLVPSSAADRPTLLRRLSFNLIGLPPTPEEIREFVEDSRPDAYARQVDRLLASPHYGERWGRMWLDLARYSDTTESWLGNTTQAHLYRDWVIQAFNADVPYDQFVRRQLATDLLPETGLEDLPALGFFGLSPTYFKELLLPPDIIKVIVADEWEERVDAFGRTFLGLTVACARCHDHKFDPIGNDDFYALAGVFASSRMTQRPMIPDELYAPVAKAKTRVAEIEEELKKLRKEKEKPQERIAELEQEMQQLQANTPHYDTPLAHVVEDEALTVELAGSDPQSGSKLVYRPGAQDLNIFIRGNPNRLGPVVPRSYLKVLSESEPVSFQQGSGRLELANALFRESSPLAARVIVNRIWQGHFGRGLVDTPSNFGRLGSPPSHPELLEELSRRFVAHGWSLKWLHRELLLSATYQQSSAQHAHNLAIDPDNFWLWRMSPRRLEVEPWRDAMLAVTGELDRTLGGAGVALDDPQNHRRTIYATVHRREVSKELLMHDFPDPGLHSPQRIPTTTPLQGLFLLNSPFLQARAEALAKRLQEEFPDSLEDRVNRAHQLLYGRQPSSQELQLATDFLAATVAQQTVALQADEQMTDATPSADSATAALHPDWIRYTHALLASNEFLFVD